MEPRNFVFLCILLLLSGCASADKAFSPTSFDSSEHPPIYETKLHFPQVPQGTLIIKHHAYALEYDEYHEQAKWLAYVLTGEMASSGAYGRKDNFQVDPMIATGSASPKDHRGSGFDRGHLVPAGDMKWCPVAIGRTPLCCQRWPLHLLAFRYHCN